MRKNPLPQLVAIAGFLYRQEGRNLIKAGKSSPGQLSLFGGSNWDESKHPRDHGKFTSGGRSVPPALPVISEEDDEGGDEGMVTVEASDGRIVQVPPAVRQWYEDFKNDERWESVHPDSDEAADLADEWIDRMIDIVGDEQAEAYHILLGLA